jgi:hypothetical protein
MKNSMDLMFGDGMIDIRETFEHSRSQVTSGQISTPNHSNYSRISYHSGNSDKDRYYDNSRSSSERQRASSDESLNTL